MAGLALKPGAVVDYRGRRYTCGGRGPGGGYLLVPHSGRGNRVLKPESAFDALEKGYLILVEEGAEYDGEPFPNSHFDLSALAVKERDLVLMRYFYMQRLVRYRNEGGTLSNASLDDFSRQVYSEYIAECGKKNTAPPKARMSSSALRGWFKRWRSSGGHVSSLVKDAKGNSHSRLTAEQEQFLYTAIYGDYMDTRRLTARHVHTLMMARIKLENRAREASGETPIPVLTYNTLIAHLSRVDLYAKLTARYSAAYALKVTRQYGVTPPANQHLVRVQVDHTLLDFYADFGYRVLVRPWLTLILDSFCKAVLGFWLTPDPPSAESVMQALRVAILPKNMRELGGDSAWHWPMHGLPTELVVDNGREFHGKDLEMAAAELGFTLTFTPPRQPWYKSQIERKFGEINRSLLAQLPGQVFKYEPEKHGVDYPHLTLDEFKRIFLQWVTTVLHRTPNRDGYTPEELWHASVQKHGTPGSGLSTDYIETCLAKTVTGKIIHPNGIHLNNLTYNNEWLSRMRNELAPTARNGKPMVKIKWSASNVGRIYVLHPGTHTFFPVESKEEYAHGRSLHNHRVVWREKNARKNAAMQDSGYTDAILALDQAIEKVIAKKPERQKLGLKLARYKDGKPKPKPHRVKTASPEPFDLDEPIEDFGDDIVDLFGGEIFKAKAASTDRSSQGDKVSEDPGS